MLKLTENRVFVHMLAPYQGLSTLSQFTDCRRIRIMPITLRLPSAQTNNLSERRKDLYASTRPIQ